MSKINQFLVNNNIRISKNPCISPDFCLDWENLKKNLRAGLVERFPKSTFNIENAVCHLVSDLHGDHAWLIEWNNPKLVSNLDDFIELSSGVWGYPATFANLLKLKNLVQKFNPKSTIFPTATGTLKQTSIGVGARFTTLHWPAVEWTMSKLNLSLTANQNSIPRELVYDVDEMLAGSLDTVPFPFIGANVPEGHQGQSVQGMSHGSILSKLKTGFHQKGIPWGFNADHQPIGGKFDSREDKLVEGCVLASYITFDLSPELAQTKIPATAEARYDFVKKEVPSHLLDQVRTGLSGIGITVSEERFDELLATVWISMKKMKARDEKYRVARERLFTEGIGRDYYRELSIDELPGLTAPETTATMLLLCRAMGMPVQYIAPAFGFQKNFPYPDNEKLRALIQATWDVCKKLDVSIGFHSGSGKSAENYRIMGEVTGGRFEIKTSGRFTYEMGVALSQSKNPADQKLWHDWYDFTREMACAGAFSPDATEQKMARQFITETLAYEKVTGDVFESPETCKGILSSLKPNTEHMYWFEYNFLYVLAGGGKASKASLGDHSPVGYEQRSRFYTVSDEARVNYSRRVAEYLVFLAESSGLISQKIAGQHLALLKTYKTQQEFEQGIL